MLKFAFCAALCALEISSGTAAPPANPQSEGRAFNANLSNIQQNIASARVQSLSSGDLSSLESIASGLRAMNQRPTGQLAYYVPYWLSYTDYLLANAYLKAKKRPEATAALQEAYSLLDSMASPDVETYALLSLVAGLRIAVTTPEQIGTAIGQARDALEKAVAAGPGNVRVLYARALADYTTPKEYGGGRVAEKYARSVVELPREPNRALRPTWGRDESAALLIRILRASNRADEANALYTRFIAEYPNSAALRLAAPTS
jgi:tetratricopeptide (TPR) repeat protein